MSEHSHGLFTCHSSLIPSQFVEVLVDKKHSAMQRSFANEIQ